jgi:hypothetical protein
MSPAGAATFSKKNQQRLHSFFDQGCPKKVRIYFQTGTADCWTIVFTGSYRKGPRDSFLFLGASDNPYHPQGIGTHGESDSMIDRPAYSHLGKPRKYRDLPEPVQKFVMENYLAIWGFTNADNEIQ